MKIKGRHAFRGQANAKWLLTASAYRRLMRNLDPAPGLVDGLFSGYLHELVDDARARFPAETGGQPDLEIMARLQHFGSATALIDFTENPRVALWMACQSAKNERGEEMDGQVFAVPLDGERIREVPDEMVSDGNLKDFFSAHSDRFGRLWFWRPEDGGTVRVFAQQSVFVFGRPEIKGDLVRFMPDPIPAEVKREILKMLEERGISEQGLFPDFPGFAAANGQDRDFPVRGGKRYQDRADAIEKDCMKARGAAALSSYDVHVLRAEFRRREGDLRGALEEYNRAHELAPQDVFILNDRGNVKNMLGDFRGALADFDRAIEYAPQYAAAYNNRSTSKGSLGDYRGALADCDCAIRIEPENAVLYNSRGNCKNMLGDHERALADFDRAIVLGPKYALAYNNRGNVKNTLGDYPGALADFDRAIGLDPQNMLAYNNRGISKQYMGDHSGALADYKRAVELNPADAWVHNNIGNANREMGDHKSAIGAFNHALGLEERAEFYFNRGLAKFDIGGREGAVADWKKAKRLAEEAGNKEVLREVGRALGEFNKPE